MAPSVLPLLLAVPELVLPALLELVVLPQAASTLAAVATASAEPRARRVRGRLNTRVVTELRFIAVPL
jgi:hypothetical protein